MNGYHADCCQANDHRAIPCKMVMPFIGSGIVEGNNLAGSGVDACGVWTFESVAAIACQSKVLQRVIQNVLFGEYVVDVKGPGGLCFW